MPFEPGQVITRRYLRGRWCTWAQPMRVISDDEAGLLLWHPAGSDFARLIDADGNTRHDITVDRMRDPKLTVHVWQDCDILVLMPPAVAHSVWWFFEQGQVHRLVRQPRRALRPAARRRGHQRPRPGHRGDAGTAVGMEGRRRRAGKP